MSDTSNPTTTATGVGAGDWCATGGMPPTSAADMQREYLTALRSTSFADLAPLREAGVGGPGLAIGPAVAAIRVSKGRFEFDPDGDATAFIVPVRVDNPISPEATDPVHTTREGEIIDLLAF